MGHMTVWTQTRFGVVLRQISVLHIKGLDTSIAPLTWVRLVTSSALQSRKWQLIGMSQWRRSALCGHPLPTLTDSWTHGAASRHTIAPISHTRPSPRSLSYDTFPGVSWTRNLSVTSPTLYHYTTASIYTQKLLSNMTMATSLSYTASVS